MQHYIPVPALGPFCGHAGGNNVVRLLWKALLPAPEESLPIPFTFGIFGSGVVLYLGLFFWFGAVLLGGWLVRFLGSHCCLHNLPA